MKLMFMQILLAAVAAVASDSSVYDQRQSGKTNVRVELKDALIIAVGDEEGGGDYDYTYDYSDLTIKPPSAQISSKPTSTTTVAPSKTTTAQSSTKTSTTQKIVNETQNPIILEAENGSLTFPQTPSTGNQSTESENDSTSRRPVPVPSFPFEGLLGKQAFKFMPAKNLNKEENRVPLTGDEALVEPENFPKRRCSSGFFLDDRNRCKRIAFKAKREKRRRSQPKVFTFPQEK